jgi:hypothetical protein
MLRALQHNLTFACCAHLFFFGFTVLREEGLTVEVPPKSKKKCCARSNITSHLLVARIKFPLVFQFCVKRG